ncbi:MAG: RHS repeat protein [Acidobacteria bacterium]|nr:RHS repeat protein [Acidobacteriota bacterium]
MTYRIQNGSVLWIRDANGNKTELTYSNGRLTKITDANGREVEIAWASGNVGYHVITYKGNSGVTRTIKLELAAMESALRSDSSIMDYDHLFPAGAFYNGSTVNNPIVIRSIEYPSGQTIGFEYNSYGEPARVSLPTSAAIEYDYSGGFVGSPAGGEIRSNIGTGFYRRLVERRSYTDGTNLSGKTTYSRPETSNSNWSSYSNSGVVAVEHKDPSNAVLASERRYFNGNGAGATTIMPYLLGDNFHQPWDDGLEIQTDLIDSNSFVLRRELRTWQPLNSRSWGGEGPVEIQNESVLEPASANLRSRVVLQYDQYGNVTDRLEYDFGVAIAGPLLRRTHTDFVTDSAYTSSSGAHLRNLPATTWISQDSAGNSILSRTVFEYDNYAADSRHAVLVDRTMVTGHDSANYGPTYLIRGNLTSSTGYSEAQSQTGAVSAYIQYDILGNAVKTFDASGNASTITYGDNYGSPDNNATTNSPPAQLNGQATFALPTAATNPMGWTSYVQYDFFTGFQVNTQDINGVISKTVYDDDLDRPTESAAAVGTPLEQRSVVEYDDANRRIEMRKDMFDLNDGLARTESYYDGFGRTTETRKYETDGYIAVKTEYDALGRLTRVTNPFRPFQNDPEVWTESKYDSLSRMIEVKTADNAKILASYYGNTVTVTDQAGAKRRSVTNAIGQLIRVDEPDADGELGDTASPIQPTVYSYDVLNNLLQVHQTGTTVQQCGGSTINCSQTRTLFTTACRDCSPRQVPNPELFSSRTIQTAI